MNAGNDNGSQSNSSTQPDRTYPMQPTMNPYFMSQTPHSAPFMPQYYQTPPYMPYQNMMTPAFNPMMFSVPDQSTSNLWKSGPSHAPNQSWTSAPKSLALFSQSSGAMPYPQNIENIPPSGTSVASERPCTVTKSNLTPQNLPSSSKNVRNSSMYESAPSASKNYGNSAVASSSKSDNRTEKEENNSVKRVADFGKNELEKGAKWFKGEFQIKSKEPESSASVDTETKDTSALPPPPPPYIPEMRLLVGTVEQVLKWSLGKKSIQSAKILIMFVGMFVKELKSDQYHHLLLVKGLNPNSPSLQVAFYTTDRALPKLIANEVALFTGHMKGTRRMQVYDIENVPANVLSDLQRIMQFSERAFQELPQTF